ncbi:MAG: hypothetical protein ACKVWR_07910 [Acidimicrobiales bacterium]
MTTSVKPELKKISVRKPGEIRLTAMARYCYGCCCCQIVRLA